MLRKQFDCNYLATGFNASAPRGLQDSCRQDGTNRCQHVWYSEKNKRDPARHGKRDTRDPARHGQRDTRDPARHGQRDTRDPARHGQRDARDPARHGQRDARDPARHGQRDARDPARHGQRDARDPARHGQRDARDPARHGQKDTRDPEKERESRERNMHRYAVKKHNAEKPIQNVIATDQTCKGWFEKLKLRFDLHHVKLVREADHDETKNDPPQLIERTEANGFLPEHVFNADEAIILEEEAILYLLVQAGKICSGIQGVVIQDCLILLRWCNAAGDFFVKLMLLFRSLNPPLTSSLTPPS
uniref:Uncharacterized protein n=1 Tax=Eptatretus burgeri TaxID=7764 RepID=A0A8C4QLF3_EPTBU